MRLQLSPGTCGDLLADHYKMFGPEVIRLFERIIAQSYTESTMYLVDRGLIPALTWPFAEPERARREAWVKMWQQQHGYKGKVEK
jgi:hypothetical protein